MRLYIPLQQFKVIIQPNFALNRKGKRYKLHPNSHSYIPQDKNDRQIDINYRYTHARIT